MSHFSNKKDDLSKKYTNTLRMQRPPSYSPFEMPRRPAANPQGQYQNQYQNQYNNAAQPQYKKPYNPNAKPYNPNAKKPYVKKPKIVRDKDLEARLVYTFYNQKCVAARDLLLDFAIIYGVRKMVETFDPLDVSVELREGKKQPDPSKTNEFPKKPRLFFTARNKEVIERIKSCDKFIQYLHTKFTSNQIDFRPMFKTDEARIAHEEKMKKKLELRKKSSDLLNKFFQLLYKNTPLV